MRVAAGKEKTSSSKQGKTDGQGPCASAPGFSVACSAKNAIIRTNACPCFVREWLTNGASSGDQPLGPASDPDPLFDFWARHRPVGMAGCLADTNTPRGTPGSRLQ
ncbi:MAG: hypothetical protein Kow0010_02040 [Dehalococcoidia bacterium]